MNQLVLAFFGSFEAMLGNQPLINFRSAKIQGLLIYLSLTQHQAHGRDTLAALFWPDESETIAKQNLRQSLYRLRLVLEDTTSKKEPYLLINRATVQFNTASDFALDVHTFRTHLLPDTFARRRKIGHGLDGSNRYRRILWNFIFKISENPFDLCHLCSISAS